MAGDFLEIQPTGTKGWRFRGTFNGKRFLLALGPYLTSRSHLQEKGRKKSENCRKIIHPAEHRREQREELGGYNPSALANEWLEKIGLFGARPSVRKLNLFYAVIFHRSEMCRSNLMPAEI